MRYSILRQKFFAALRWNGILFFINKLSKIAITFFLFSRLSTHDFATWANVFSLVFILALWMDFGFRKSLPLFCPLFSQNQKAKKRFIRGIIFFKLALGILANGILFLCAPLIARVLHLAVYKPFFYLGCLLFFVETIQSTLQFLFHSYFWQKQFNILESIVIATKTGTLFMLIVLVNTSSTLLYSVFIAEITALGVIIVGALLMLGSLFGDKHYQENRTIDTRALTKAFMLHSGAMWSFLVINSLTERNVLIPFFTAILGPATANIFKVANDAALLLQRFVIKTIGTADTSLLANLETNPESNTSMLVVGLTTTSQRCVSSLQQATYLLTKNVTVLTVPLFGILFLTYHYRQTIPQMLNVLGATMLEYHTSILTTFILLASLYLVQILFLAYDRLLEVRRHYREIFISLLPYISLFVLFFATYSFNNSITSTSLLLELIICIHSIRMLSLAIRLWYTRKYYRIQFPLIFALMVLGVTTAASMLFYVIFNALT